MTLTLTPEPSSGPNDPPRVRADLVASDGGTFTALSVRRGASLIRRQPFVGAGTSQAFDYEAPFGQPVTYTAEGFVLPVTEPDWTEAWSNLSSWSGDTSDWSTAGGVASSSVADAAIERDAAGVIQRVTVADPVLVRLELLDAASNVVCSLQVDAAKVTLVGSSSTQASGGGSFALLLDDDTVTASADDSSWSLSRPYSGSPETVRLVALGETNLPRELTAPARAYKVKLGPTGDVYTFGADSSLTTLQVIKYDPLLGAPTVVIAALPSVTYQSLAVGSDGAIYLADYTNQQVVKYDASGALVTSWPAGGKPMSICLDSDDNVFVGTNTPSPRIFSWTSSGTPITDWPVTQRAIELATDSVDNVYAMTISGGSSRVYKFTAAGSSIGDWAVAWGSDMTVADDTVYVYGGNIGDRVYMYSVSGVAIRDWAAISGRYAYGVAANADGDVYLLGADPTYTSYLLQRFALVDSAVGEVEVTPVTEPEPYSSSATTTLVETRAWLVHPSQPSLSVSIDENKWRETSSNVSIESAQQTTHEQPVSAFSPPGRSRSVVYPLGPRKAGSWTLVLNAPTLIVRDAILSLLADGAPLLLRSPGWDWDLPDGWYAVGDVTQTRMVSPLQQPYRAVTLPLTPVDSPPVALVPEWTYGDLLLAAPTYGDVLAQFPTYLDVLTGSSA